MREMNDTIIIDELEVAFRVGVPDEERAVPQRLLISVDLELDVVAGAAADDLSLTVDYYAVACQIRQLGEGREWKLIETLATDVARMILLNPLIFAVQVEISKFIIPDTRRVAVRIKRTRESAK